MKTAFLISVILLVTFSNIYGSAEKIEFGYTGSKGPDFWHLLTAEADICNTGKAQSPIDITWMDLETLATPPPAKFNDAKKVEVINNGNTVEVSSGNEEKPLPATIEIEGETYELQQFHFHTPSEHRVDGKHHDVEQHLVFTSKDNKVSVVAVFYDVNKLDSKFMEPIIMNLPQKVGEKKEIEEIKLSSLLSDIKNITRAFTYSGSLTTPPCTEGVTWYVNQDAQSISVHQFTELRDVTGFNSRFTQLRAEDQAEIGNVNNGTENTKTHHMRRSLYRRSHFRK